MSEPIIDLPKQAIVKKVRKPIRPKVLAGSAGAGIAVPFMVIAAWILKDFYFIVMPDAVIIAGVGFISGVSSFIAGFLTRED